MQEVIDKIIKDFRSGDPAKKAKALKLYQNTFDVKDIESAPDCCGQLIPNRHLEFDRNNLELLSDSISPERRGELEGGATPTPSELELYRECLIAQVKNGDADAEVIPGYWIHKVRGSAGDAIYVLTTITGYSFSVIDVVFHGLFLRKDDCLEYLQARGVVVG